MAELNEKSLKTILKYIMKFSKTGSVNGNLEEVPLLCDSVEIIVAHLEKILDYFYGNKIPKLELTNF